MSLERDAPFFLSPSPTGWVSDWSPGRLTWGLVLLFFQVVHCLWVSAARQSAPMRMSLLFSVWLRYHSTQLSSKQRCMGSQRMFKQVFTAGVSEGYLRILQNMGQAEVGLGNRSQPSHIALSCHRRDEASLLRRQWVRIRVSLYGV